MGKVNIKIYFSDYFEIDPRVIEQYGAFNISLISDLPLFIDPFLLFNSRKRKYKELHKNIIKYLQFLKGKSIQGNIDKGLLKAWYYFPEVKQNWMGFSISENDGRGLGSDFAKALNENLNNIFKDFGKEKVTKGSHLEKLCLIKEGVGRDNISDFTTNLIKEYLLDYTQAFALKHTKEKFLKEKTVNKVCFNYTTETWENKTYTLPCHNDDYVLLTPKEILTKDNTWINKSDLINDFSSLPDTIPNDQLRSQIDNYFLRQLSKDYTREDEINAIYKTILEFPQIIDYFIKYKEDNGDRATSISSQRVNYSNSLYVQQFGNLIRSLANTTNFYKIKGDTYQEALDRVKYLKDIIENKDGWRIFYPNGKPIKKEEDIKILYRLTWFATQSDVTKEAGGGRGSVDYKIARGSKDKTLVEFKLASNPQLKRNLKNQVEIYKKAHDTEKAIKVIIYFSKQELIKIQKILKDLNMHNNENIVLIDARKDNKASASKV